MPWVRFTADHYHWPAAEPRSCVRYNAGSARNVTRECHANAVAAGAAVRIKAPRTKIAAAALLAQTSAPAED